MVSVPLSQLSEYGLVMPRVLAGGQMYIPCPVDFNTSVPGFVYDVLSHVEILKPILHCANPIPTTVGFLIAGPALSLLVRDSISLAILGK